MTTRFYHAKILPSPSAEIFEGEIYVADGVIDAVVRGKSLRCADREIDCGGNLLMSGFCNAHAHAAMSLFRGAADDLPLESWLYDRVFPMEKHLTAEDIYWGTLLQIAEFVRSGITCFADMYFDLDAVWEAAKKANLCLALCCGARPGTNDEICRYIEKCCDLFSTVSDRLCYFPGLHAEYTANETLLTAVADLAIERGLPTCIHLSETLQEVGECTVRHGGLTPPQYLHKIGFFENGGIAAHCVYADKDDLALLKQCDVTPVVNGASNLKLASGVAPVYSMLSNGMHPALGTDGVASNNATSMFREMYLYSCLQKECLKNASAVSAEQALEAATCNGYRALGFAGGELKAGNFADMILIDLAAPNMQPCDETKKHLVYSAGVENVLMTVAGGKIVYDHGAYDIGEDPARIYGECNTRRKRLLSAAGFMA